MRRYIVVKIEIRPEDGQYAAYCPDLGTASCGKSIEDATRNMAEALEVHLSALEELGERERFFKKHNITLHVGSVRNLDISRRVTSRLGVFTTMQALPA